MKEFEKMKNELDNILKEKNLNYNNVPIVADYILKEIAKIKIEILGKKNEKEGK